MGGAIALSDAVMAWDQGAIAVLGKRAIAFSYLVIEGDRCMIKSPFAMPNTTIEVKKS
ncbi:MAG: hypothetical protein AB4042_21310 [Leptolyngbyaceae cyanobacterium]